MTRSGMFYKMWFIAFAAMIALSGCNGFNSQSSDISLQDMGPAEIYQKGELELSKNKNKRAAEYFGEIERLYPYSEWAKRGLIMQAFAFHKDKNYQSSRGAASRFVDFYPADNDVAYAYYLIGLSYYDQIDDVGRDQGVTRNALQAFRVLFEQFPNSEYAEPAKLKFDLAFDHLASKEMEVGRYYLKDGYYSAAINRFRIVIEDFQTTKHTPEALHRLVEAYLSLGLTDDAQTAAAILGHNYKNSEWYASSYDLLTSRGLSPGAKGTGWLARVHRQVIKGQWF
jgi:outer membrane protein assembly factor BamD